MFNNNFMLYILPKTRPFWHAHMAGMWKGEIWGEYYSYGGLLLLSAR